MTLERLTREDSAPVSLLLTGETDDPLDDVGADRRQILVGISSQGRDALTGAGRAANAWPKDVLKTRLTMDERETLVHGVALLDRLVRP